jgi:hypothetical protein
VLNLKLDKILNNEFETIFICFVHRVKVLRPASFGTWFLFPPDEGGMEENLLFSPR